MSRAWTVALSAALVVAGCGGIRESGRSEVAPATVVSRREVVQAFAQQGFTLRSAGPSHLEGGGEFLAPHEPFRVVVLPDPALAERTFEPYSRHVLQAFNLLRHNVLVISMTSDSAVLELTPDVRARIAAAMNNLGH